MGTKKFVITMKNLGAAYAIGVYWYGVNVNGNETVVWNGTEHKSFAFNSSQINMSADGEWVTLEIDLSDVTAWTNLKTLSGLRIQSQYLSTSETDLTNVWYIKEMKFVQ